MSRRAKTPGFLHRALGAMSAGLVLMLTVLAASPIAHDWVHTALGSHESADHTDSPTSSAPEHECAVVLFAGGVDTPVAPLAPIPPRIAVETISPVTAAEFHLVSPRYLRQPERGPPSSWVA